MIKLNNVSKVYGTANGELQALDNVSLSVNKGEVFGIIGHSGAGKSTLIRTVNMLEQPTAGTVSVNGKELTTLPPAELQHARRKIGMIFQSFNLLKTATVRENIAIPLRLTGVSQQQTEKRVDKYLDLVNLRQRQHAHPAQLSGGEKQRVAIARALSHQPEILLSDEATSALDPETTESILQLLRRINEELGLTILLITHEMPVIQKLCDRLAVLEAGKIVEQGTVLDVFQSPGHPTTSKFVNSLFPQGAAGKLLADSATGPVVNISFAGTADQPVLATLAQRFPVTPNIVGGNIVELKNGHFGRLTVKLQGDPRAARQAIQSLRDSNIPVEEVQTCKC